MVRQTNNSYVLGVSIQDAMELRKDLDRILEELEQWVNGT